MAAGGVRAEDASRSRLDPIKPLRIQGVTDAESREFNARIAAMHAFLGALPDVRAPRPRECSSVYSNMEGRKNALSGTVQGGAVIGFMAANGPCPKLASTSIDIRLNDLRWVYSCPFSLGDRRVCTIPGLEPGPGGFLRFEGRLTFYVYVRGGEPLLIPMTKEEYLREWARSRETRIAANDGDVNWLRADLERIRARQASLSPEQRAMPACLQAAEPGMEYPEWELGTGTCASNRTLGTPNPRVVQSTPSPVDMEAIVIRAETGRVVGVSPEAHAHKQRVLRNFDFEGLVRALSQ